jgi:hypothetical protein
MSPQSINDGKPGTLDAPTISDVPLENGSFGRIGQGLKIGEKQLPAHLITVARGDRTSPDTVHKRSERQISFPLDYFA